MLLRSVFKYFPIVLMSYGFYMGSCIAAKSPTTPVLPLFHESNFSFGLSIPSQKIPTTASAFENQKTYNHLRDRLDGTSGDTTDDNSTFSGLPDVLQQFNALNFQFKLRF